MDIDGEMLAWSQTVYGVGHALHVAKSINFGNLDTIVASLESAESWNPSRLGFNSALPVKEFTPGSVKLDGSNHEEIFARVSERVTSVLFVNLAVLADEVVGDLIEQTGVRAPRYLFNKVEWAAPRIGREFQWAIAGMYEMVAIRNAIVHNGAKWNQATVEQLQAAGIHEVDRDVDISLSFGDLFRYRRALRTLVGELRKLKPAASVYTAGDVP